MARIGDAAKRRQWIERLRRFNEGEYTVVGFCAVERVSVPSFYQWRKKLANCERPLPSAGDVHTTTPAGRRGTQAFLPLQLTQAATVEIHLPNGTRVTLPTGDMSLLESAIATVARLHPLIDTEDGLC